MKIECTRDRIADAIAKAEKITGKNLTLPVLACILFEAKGRELIVRATNLDLGIEISIPVKVMKEGKVAVPGAVINNFISHIIDGKNVVLEVVEGNLRVVTGSNTTIVKSVNFEDFPTIPILEGDKKITLPAKDLTKGIKAVWYSSAISSMKPELSSVYIFSDDSGLVFAATDSFRLAEKRVKTKHGKDFGSILIPVKNIPEILRTLESVNGDITVTLSKHQISFNYDGVYLTSRVVDGVFPDYKQIIPKEHKTSIVILKQDLVNALKVATIFSDKFNKISVKAHPTEKRFELATKNADIGENINVLEAVLEGEDIDMSFNYRYITDCFQSAESDSVIFEFNGSNKALIIRGVNDSSFMYLVMPMNK